MRIRIIAKSGYTDRYGEVHDFGAVADLPDAIAVKLIRHGIAAPVLTAVRGPVETARPMKLMGRPMGITVPVEPEPEPELEPEVEPELELEPEVQKPRPRGRPRK